MKKPKIDIEITYLGPYDFEARVLHGERPLARRVALKSEKAAREWAKDWCRTVGAALMEKGK